MEKPVLKCVLCRFQLVPRTQVGQIYPPLVAVRYTDVPITDINTQTVSVSLFTHIYRSVDPWIKA